MLLEFTLRGSSPANIATLSLSVYPNAFKWLAAPIIDTHYIKLLGKRKTYLVLISFIHFIMLFIASFYIDDWVA